MKRATTLLIVLSLAGPSVLLAGKKKKKDKKADATVVVFSDDDRDVTRVYFTEKHGRGKCPPGLAKKNNGCLPPGQAKKRYVLGQPLPPEIVVIEPPPDLIIKLEPIPPGYRYVMLDGDLVKLAVGTKLVVDAIDGLVN
jgi:hypothetical protein